MSKKKKQKKEKKRKKRGVENLVQIVGANGNGSTGGEQPPRKLARRLSDIHALTLISKRCPGANLSRRGLYCVSLDLLPCKGVICPVAGTSRL